MILSGEARLIRIASKSLVSAERSWNDGLIYLNLLQNGLRSNVHYFLLRLHQLDIQTERLELADQHVEGFRQPSGARGVTLDDRFVNLRATDDVVGLRRK